MRIAWVLFFGMILAPSVEVDHELGTMVGDRRHPGRSFARVSTWPPTAVHLPEPARVRDDDALDTITDVEEVAVAGD